MAKTMCSIHSYQTAHRCINIVILIILIVIIIITIIIIVDVVVVVEVVVEAVVDAASVAFPDDSREATLRQRWPSLRARGPEA